MILNSDLQELPNNFSFKKSKNQSSCTKDDPSSHTTADAFVMTNREVLSKSAMLTRKRAIAQDHNYVPKHSFEKLIWDGVKSGPSAIILAQEAFWDQIKLEAEQFAQNLNNAKDCLDSTTASESLEDEGEFSRLDLGIPFTITPQLALTRKQFENAIVSLVRNHLSSPTATNLLLNYSIAEQLIIDGIIVSIDNDRDKEQHLWKVNIKNLNPLPPTSVCSTDSSEDPVSTSNDPLDYSIRTYGNLITNMTQFIYLIDYAMQIGDSNLAYQLYRIATIQITNWQDFEADCLRTFELNVFKTMETNKYALGLYGEMINQHSQHFDLDLIKRLYHQLVYLSLDFVIYNACWLQLKALMKIIVEWMDIGRLHFLLEWTVEFGLKVLVAHPSRILNLIRLFDMTDIEQLAVKFILDAALFGINKSTSSSSSLPPLLSVELVNRDDLNNDHAFLIALPSMTRLPWILSTVELEMIVLLSLNRLLRTKLVSAHYYECQMLYEHVDALRNSIPSNHVPVNIRLRDNLAKMKTYLRSYFTSKKQGIIAINTKKSIDQKIV